MKTVYFVRHGESISNVSKAHQGIDEPLTELGQKQAQFIAKRVAKLPIEAFIVSPVIRAHQTAEYIAKEIGKEPEFSELFIESRGPKRFWGLTNDDPTAKEAYSQISKNYGTPGWHFEDEENYEDHTRRAQAALAFLAVRSEEKILVVTHGLFLRILIAHSIFDMKPTPQEIKKITYNLETANTGITILHYDQGHAIPWRLWVWNDHAHLG
ncbi:histidine phosphatase family protein [Acetobacteraceae bacterium]|nr:histidine phosphatase family protein [Candidatus Parcubacteria bacterium]